MARAGRLVPKLVSNDCITEMMPTSGLSSASARLAKTNSERIRRSTS